MEWTTIRSARPSPERRRSPFTPDPAAAAEIEALAEQAMPGENDRGRAADMCAVVEARIHGDRDLLSAYCRFRGKGRFDDVRGAMRAFRAAHGEHSGDDLGEEAVEAYIAVEAARSEAVDRGLDTTQYRALSRAAVARPDDLALILAAAPRGIESYDDLVRVLDEMGSSAGPIAEGSL